MTEPIYHEPLNYTEIEGEILPIDQPDSSGWAGNGSFDHLITSSAELSGDVEPSVDVIDEPSKRKIRQQKLLNEQGFLATSPGELVRATGLTDSDANLSAGAASYIARIIRRQVGLKSKPDDPVAAGRAVTRDMIDYAKKARGDRAAVLHLREILDSTDLLSITPITEISSLKDGHYDGILGRGLSDLLRLTEAIEFSSPSGTGQDHLADAYGSPDKDMMKKLRSFVESLTMSETNDLITMSDKQHQAQFEFWVARIKEIEKYSTKAVKGMAKVALGDLGVTKPE